MARPPKNIVLEHLRLVAEWLGVKHPTKRFELVIGGGAAMALLGLPKTTFDVDVFRPSRLPPEVVEGAGVVGRAKGLGADWLNDGLARAVAAATRGRRLPVYFNERAAVIEVAPNLTVAVVGRQALISMKLLAATPSSRKHIDDLRALEATADELKTARAFVVSVDNTEPRIEDLDIVLEKTRGHIVNELVSHNLWRAWRTLGIPAAIEPLDEGRHGIIDPEALIVLTVRHGRDARMLENIAAWADTNADLLVAQKLRALMTQEEGGSSPPRSPELSSLPPKLRAALGIRGTTTAKPSLNRSAKLAPRSAIAQRSRVIFNRLLYGVSARADIIAAHEIRGLKTSGAELAQLLGVDASTVSRVRKDLRDCGVLDAKGLHIGRRRFPGYFVSTRTVITLPQLLDAGRVKDPSLKSAMLPNVDRNLDGLSHAILRGNTVSVDATLT